MNNHLTDDEIQQFVLNNHANYTAIQHIKMCEACKASAANYAIVFKAVAEVPKPLFAFDVVNMVMPALPKPKQLIAQDDYFTYAVISVAIGLLCIPVYLYKKDLVKIFENMAWIVIVLIALPVIAILCLQFYDVYKVYKKQVAVIK